MHNTQKRTWAMPDSYVIIFFVVLAAAVLTWFIPVGMFTESEETAGGKTVLVRDSFTTSFLEQDGELIADPSGREVRRPLFALFKPFGELGILNYVFEGFTSGDKWGSAVGVMAFILIVGGAFGIILKTGAVEAGILAVIKRTQGREVLIIPILFLLFSLGGAVFGMGEEAIAFAMIIIPIVIALGYDAITGILVTYVATQVGFASSWMNPFSVIIAQGIAGVPGGGSSMVFRIVMWIVFTSFATVFTLLYARRIKQDPRRSISYSSDAYFREDMESSKQTSTGFLPGHALVLLILLAGVIWIVWGVVGYGAGKGYYIPSIASVFFIMGLAAGIIAVIFGLNGMTVNGIAEAFREGAKDLLGAAMVVGMAKAIILVLGGSNYSEPNVLNTILYSISNALRAFPPIISAWLMYLFQSIFNFFVVSGSGQAALTMPIMAPLADQVGVSRDLAILAFQLGDGLTNVIVPTSACLMGVLGVAHLDWGRWARFQIKFQGLLVILATLFMIAGWFILT